MSSENEPAPGANPDSILWGGVNFWENKVGGGAFRDQPLTERTK